MDSIPPGLGILAVLGVIVLTAWVALIFGATQNSRPAGGESNEAEERDLRSKMWPGKEQD